MVCLFTYHNRNISSAVFVHIILSILVVPNSTNWTRPVCSCSRISGLSYDSMWRWLASVSDADVGKCRDSLCDSVMKCGTSGNCNVWKEKRRVRSEWERNCENVSVTNWLKVRVSLLVIDWMLTHSLQLVSTTCFILIVAVKKNLK